LTRKGHTADRLDFPTWLGQLLYGNNVFAFCFCPMLSSPALESMGAWRSENTLLACDRSSIRLHACLSDPRLSGLFPRSRLYCTTLMQEERVEREKGACVWTGMDLSPLNMLGVL
jgi:hypothetical protein